VATGNRPSEAEDEVQGFFEMLLRREDLQGLNPDYGKFRAYLITCFKHHRIDLRRKEQAKKRGGEFQFCSLSDLRDEVIPERARDTPEASYDRAWAWHLIHVVRDELRERMADAEDYRVLECYLPGGSAPSLQEGADRLGVSLGAMKTRVRRFRQDFGSRLIAAVSETVGDQAEIEEELQYLMRVLSR